MLNVSVYALQWASEGAHFFLLVFICEQPSSRWVCFEDWSTSTYCDERKIPIVATNRRALGGCWLGDTFFYYLSINAGSFIFYTLAADWALCRCCLRSVNQSVQAGRMSSEGLVGLLIINYSPHQQTHSVTGTLKPIAVITEANSIKSQIRRWEISMQCSQWERRAHLPLTLSSNQSTSLLKALDWESAKLNGC